MPERKRPKPLRLGKVWNLVTTAQHGTLQKLLTKDSNTEIEDEDEYDLTPIEWLVEQLTVGMLPTIHKF